MGAAPVVKFTVVDADGTPIASPGQPRRAPPPPFPALPNLAFAMAKLLPAPTGRPASG